MSALFGVRLKLGEGEDAIHVFTGWGIHRYAFRAAEAAREFIADNWPQFSASWKDAHLSAAPLPPCVTVPGHYLIFDHHGEP